MIEFLRCLFAGPSIESIRCLFAGPSYSFKDARTVMWMRRSQGMTSVAESCRFCGQFHVRLR